MTQPGEAHRTMFSDSWNQHMQAVREMGGSLALLQRMAETIITSLRAGGTVFWCGNGGSAADAQHMAAELVGRFRRERRALASIALTTDTSILTALANDYGYECVFARQLESLCRKGDVVIGISTSGNSANVCRAMAKAREIGAHTLAFVGQSACQLSSMADFCFAAPSRETARIQECHTLALHMICDAVEEALAEESK